MSHSLWVALLSMATLLRTMWAARLWVVEAAMVLAPRWARCCIRRGL